MTNVSVLKVFADAIVKDADDYGHYAARVQLRLRLTDMFLCK